MSGRLKVGETAENVMGYFYCATSGFHIKFREMHLLSKPCSWLSMYLHLLAKKYTFFQNKFQGKKPSSIVTKIEESHKL